MGNPIAGHISPGLRITLFCIAKEVFCDVDTCKGALPKNRIAGQNCWAGSKEVA
jgi:hypothetical protein